MTDAQPTQDDTAGATPEATPGTHIFTGQLFRVRKGRGWTFVDQPPAPPEPVRRPARVARMLALAHRLQAAIDRGEYRDRAELARQLGLTRARISQLLALTLLAPDLKERVLFLEAVDGREPLTERALRDVVRHEGWGDQRGAWQQLRLDE
ncbi:MAG TPA: hypothetical protein ENK57_18675 [Polyangiaceae bacterium]|nr:hypothetical protein [Polyangiaceae bacterium]